VKSFKRMFNGFHWLVGLGMVASLYGCAGTEKPKPAELEPNTALISVRTAWTNSIGTVGYPLNTRVVGDKVFVASSQGNIAALDATTGKDIWRTQVGGPLSAGVGSDGTVTAVVNRDNEVIALEGGKVTWRQKLSAVTMTAPLVAGARVFTLSGDRTVTAFDAATGRKLWQQQRTGDSLLLGQSGVLFAHGDTLIAGLSGRLVGFNPLNGTVRWDALIASSRGTNEVERLVDLVAGVQRDGDTACLRSFQTSVACVNLVKGSLIWSKPASGNSGVTGDAESLFGSESDGKLVAWKHLDGERLWSVERFRFRGLSMPLLAGRSVVVGDAFGFVHFVSKEDGSTLNRMATDGSAIVAAPVLAQRTLVVVTRNGGVFGFRPD
jgi:outer membrane assembly lipoprotein YfgL